MSSSPSPAYLFPPYLNARDSNGQRSQGPAVFVLKLFLIAFVLPLARGLHPQRRLQLDNIYDEALVDHVTLLQHFLGFVGDSADGNFGPRTRGELNAQFGINFDKILQSILSGPTTWIAPNDSVNSWPTQE
ncbi:MAG: hypothetical protein V1778_00565 [bacterium]